MKKLREIRKARGLSVANLSDKSGVSVSYLHNLENGHKNNPTLATLVSLTKALNCKMEDLY